MDQNYEWITEMQIKALELGLSYTETTLDQKKRIKDLKLGIQSKELLEQTIKILFTISENTDYGYPEM